MGGCAFLPGLECGRMNRAEHDALARRVLDAVGRTGAAEFCRPTRAWTTKGDFGDVDVVVGFRCAARGAAEDPSEAADRIVDAVARDLRAVARATNSHVTSLAVPSHDGGDDDPPTRARQVDLILLPLSADETGASATWTHGIHSYSCLGSLLSVALRGGPLRCSWDGLYAVADEGDPLHELAEALSAGRDSRRLLLTRDLSAALRFLGLDPEAFDAGFRDEVELVRFVSESPFVRWADLLSAARSERGCDRFRAAVLAYAAATGVGSRAEEREAPAPAPTLAAVLAAFGRTAEYEERLQRMRGVLRARAAFNGSLAGRLTGLRGRDLGRFMASFRAEHPDVAALPDVEAAVLGHMRRLKGPSRSTPGSPARPESAS